MGKGDVLASGGKKATFAMGGDTKDSPISLKNVAPEDEPGNLHSRVDNSALFARKRPSVFYQGQPLGDRVLIKRVERQSNSMILLPDSAKGKSDMGLVVSVGCGLVDFTTGLRTPLSVQAGDLVLFDKFAAVGQEVTLVDENGDEAEHLVVQEHDIILKLQAVQVVEAKSGTDIQ